MPDPDPTPSCTCTAPGWWVKCIHPLVGADGLCDYCRRNPSCRKHRGES